MIALHVHSTVKNIIATVRNFSPGNRAVYSRKLIKADWTHLYAINDVDTAFNYFITKLKRFYNKSFPFTSMKLAPLKNLG